MTFSVIKRFEIGLLLSFYVVAQELHFGRAADRLNVSPPPLSRRIKRLEEQLGTALLERSTRNVTLTPAGMVMYRELNKVFEHLDDIYTQILEASNLKEKTLSIGITPSVSFTPLVESLARFKLQRLNVDLQLTELNTTEMPQALNDRTIDLGLFRPNVDDPNIRLISVYSEPVSVVSRHNYISQTSKYLLAEQLANYPIINYNGTSSPYLRKVVDDLFKNLKIQPHYVQESELPMILTLAQAGIGIALVPQSIALSRSKHLYITTLAAPNMPSVETAIGVLRTNTNTLVKDLTEYLLNDSSLVPALSQ
ncbi:DNA-binding transcriptional LysR family regulator OS=Castellaniella defragrans OX=75697 GN=HNR28_000549 PE=3 SV=1 [Castellaniella defragrans]